MRLLGVGYRAGVTGPKCYSVPSVRISKEYSKPGVQLITGFSFWDGAASCLFKACCGAILTSEELAWAIVRATLSPCLAVPVHRPHPQARLRQQQRRKFQPAGCCGSSLPCRRAELSVYVCVCARVGGGGCLMELVKAGKEHMGWVFFCF